MPGSRRCYRISRCDLVVQCVERIRHVVKHIHCSVRRLNRHTMELIQQPNYTQIAQVVSSRLLVHKSINLCN